MTPANNIGLSPVLIWGGIQIALLGICAGEFPLWLHHPYPRESAAIEVMWCGQVLSIALLAPVLFRSGWVTVMGIVMMAAMDELAGVFSNCPQFILAKGFVCVIAWLIGLAGLSWMNQDVRYQLLVNTVAILVVAGGALLDYLRWEVVAAGGTPNPTHPISLLPKLCAVATSNSGVPWQWALMPMIVLIGVGLIGRRPISTSTTLHKAE